MLPCKQNVLLRLNPSNSGQQLPRRCFPPPPLSQHVNLRFPAKFLKPRNLCGSFWRMRPGWQTETESSSTSSPWMGHVDGPAPATLTELTPPDPRKEGNAFQEFESRQRRTKIRLPVDHCDPKRLTVIDQSREELIVSSRAPEGQELFLEQPAAAGALLPFLGPRPDPNHPLPTLPVRAETSSLQFCPPL